MDKSYEHKICKKCGGTPKVHGCDHCNDEGPWTVACEKCGRESLTDGDYCDSWKRWDELNSHTEVS